MRDTQTQAPCPSSKNLAIILAHILSTDPFIQPIFTDSSPELGFEKVLQTEMMWPYPCIFNIQLPFIEYLLFARHSSGHGEYSNEQISPSLWCFHSDGEMDNLQ